MKKYITVQTAKREIEQGFLLDSMIFGELMKFKDGKMDVDDLIHEINVQAIKEAKNSLEEVESGEDVTPVIHAQWRWMRNNDVICTKCQYVLPNSSPVSDFWFCPHCGATIDEVVY